MRTRRWLTWLIFSICALAVLEGLGWITWQALRSERREAEARAQSEFQERIRLALWRMESEVTPIIAQEAARPYFHYRPFYPAERAYNRMWQEVESGEVLVPSPLLESSGQFVRLHFQVAPDGQITSPQSPTGNMRDLAESQYVDGEFIVLAGELLDELSAIVTSDPARQLQTASSEAPPQAAVDPSPQQLFVEPLRDDAGGAKAASRSDKEFEVRQQTAQNAYSQNDQRRNRAAGSLGESKVQNIEIPATVAAAPPPAEVPPGRETTEKAIRKDSDGPVLAADSKLRTETAKKEGPALSEPSPSVLKLETDMLDPTTAGSGSPLPGKPAAPKLKQYQSVGPVPDQHEVEQGPLLPRWWRNPRTGADELIVQRTVTVRGRDLSQGFWCDWPGLRSRLVASISDLLPRATLRPVWVDTEQAAPRGLRLASLPVLLVPGSTVVASIPAWTPTHVTLGLTWFAVIAAIAAFGFVLRAAMELGDRRGRFVSAVTHELRTPLTTFCLYTEMLADGMVKDDGARRDYLATLKNESKRLAGIVENVLEYARLGGGRRTNGHAVAPAGALLDQVTPHLRQRARAASMELEILARGVDRIDLAIDPQTFERILTNLVDNACKYAGDAADRRIHLAAMPTRAGIEIRVRDHGPGVPRREHRRIFQAFQRGRDANESAKSGLGLGLALARGLARGSGGDLRLGDASGGAEFILSLPAAPANPVH